MHLEGIWSIGIAIQVVTRCCKPDYMPRRCLADVRVV